MSYDIKYRRRAIEYWDEGHTKKETAAVFGIGTSTLQTWKSQLKKTGTLAPKKRRETWRKIDPEKLRMYVEEHPDAFQKELADIFGVRLYAIQKALKRLKITRKKNYPIQGNRRKFSTGVCGKVEKHPDRSTYLCR